MSRIGRIALVLVFLVTGLVVAAPPAQASAMCLQTNPRSPVAIAAVSGSDNTASCRFGAPVFNYTYVVTVVAADATATARIGLQNCATSGSIGVGVGFCNAGGELTFTLTKSGSGAAIAYAVPFTLP